MNDDLLHAHGLPHLAAILSRFQTPAVGFSMTPVSSPIPVGASKLGGNPDLAADLEWPLGQARALDFLLQINLSETAPFDSPGLFPASGLLSFFYDLENQPWGFDPKELDGFRVLFFPSDATLTGRELPNQEYRLPEHRLSFHQTMTIPHPGSRAMEQFVEQAKLSAEEISRYWDFAAEFEKQFYPADSGLHHLLGHSANIQGDMQLEAQLVTNGLYCGNETGYNDPRARELETGVDDWQLLLQLDSDDTAEIMWGDCGMLYFWIRKSDLQQLRFDKVWMSLQCS